jgi:hypothetical protein
MKSVHPAYILLIIIGIISSILSSCANRKITGVYKRTLFDEQLILDSNHRFVYKFNVHLIGYNSRGAWRIDNKNIYLFSDSDVTAINRKVKESYVLNQTYTKLQFFDLDCKTPYRNFPVIFNDSITLITDSIGSIVTNIVAEHFFARIISYYEAFYQKKSSNSNSFTVCLMPATNSEVFFLNKKYRFYGKYLIDENGFKLKKQKGSPVSQ